MSTQFAGEALDRRRPVWVALAHLFLDTDVSLFDDKIVAVLRASKFDAEEVEKIIREEVGPVFYTNLLDIAGEWAGWSEEHVAEDVEAYLDTSKFERAWRRLLSTFVVRHILSRHWPRLKMATWTPA